MLVSEVIDRTYNEWLYPAGVDRPSFDTVKTVGDLVGVGEGTFELDGRIANVPKDTILEIDDELILTKDVTGAAPTVTVTTAIRGYLESAAAAHAVGAKAFLDPKYPRIAVFNTLKALIGRLYPLGLYWRNSDMATTFTTAHVLPLPADGKKILSIIVRSLGSEETYSDPLMKGMDYIEYLQFDPPKYHLRAGGGEGASMVVTYAKDFGVPAATSDDLTTLGVSDSLADKMPMAIAGHLLQGKDLPRVVVEELRRMLAAQAGNVPPGAAYNIGQTLVTTFERKFVMEERRRLAELDPPTFEWVRR